MKIYAVGGSVRDTLLNRPIKDRDYVVVGATEQQMLDLGFKKVGADFPVFLSADGEEYALARQERKSGHGYHGFEVVFDPSVTLADDLIRRDLTINAMAMDEDGRIIDPYNGQQDLNSRVLRHVSAAFADDPVRVLRVARFAARYDFEVAPETMELMKSLVDSGELDHLTPERVWAEFEKAMSEQFIDRFFQVMNTCGAMEKLFQGLNVAFIMSHLDLIKATEDDADLTTRMVILFSALNRHDFDIIARSGRFPTFPRDVVRLVMKHRRVVELMNVDQPSHVAMLNVLREIDAFRHPDDVNFWWKRQNILMLVLT